MAKRKSATDHLNGGREPHIVHMIPPGAPGYREADGGAMVVSSPKEVDDYVRKIAPGEVATLEDLRRALARAHQVATACPVSTAIFANLSARAAEEARNLGADPETLTPLSCSPLLDHLAGLHPALTGGGGPCAADRFNSDIGGLLPIALCGRTSL